MHLERLWLESTVSWQPALRPLCKHYSPLCLTLSDRKRFELLANTHPSYMTLSRPEEAFTLLAKEHCGPNLQADNEAREKALDTELVLRDCRSTGPPVRLRQSFKTVSCVGVRTRTGSNLITTIFYVANTSVSSRKNSTPPFTTLLDTVWVPPNTLAVLGGSFTILPILPTMIISTGYSNSAFN